MISKIKIIKPLIIGLGVAGRRHLDAQISLGIKTGVYTNNPETAKTLKKRRDVIVFDKLEDGIKWSNLVHVCTPDDKHTEFVAMALKEKKAVLCEKSLTTGLKDALYLQQLARKYKSTLIVGQNYRLTPSFSETKKRIITGEIGSITKIETTYLHDKDEYQKRATLNKNKDFLYIAGSHAVDLASWIAGEPIKDVNSVSIKHKNLPTTYQITITFASGLPGYIKLDASSSYPTSGTDLIVEGAKGRLISHNKSDELLFYRRGITKPQSIPVSNNKTYTTALEVKIIDDYLLGRKDSYWPLPNVDEILNIVTVLNAVQKASANNN